MIELNQITLNFGNNKVFDQFSLKVSQGSKCCISGPSGKGKSTLLKIIQGFIKPQGGDVVISNEKLTSKTITSIRDKIAWVPQNVDLPVESGEELAHLLKISPKKHKDIIELMMQLGLDSDLFYSPFKEISGGQKQRIVLAVCIAQSKPLLILDEPTSSLDEESIGLLVQLVNSLDEVTVVSTSHNDNWIKKSSQVIKL